MITVAAHHPIDADADSEVRKRVRGKWCCEKLNFFSGTGIADLLEEMLIMKRLCHGRTNARECKSTRSITYVTLLPKFLPSCHAMSMTYEYNGERQKDKRKEVFDIVYRCLKILFSPFGPNDRDQSHVHTMKI